MSASDKAIRNRTAREWRRGDSDPGDHALRVRDCHGDVWTPQEVLGLGVRVWSTPETKPATWDYLLKKWGPVAEVPPPVSSPDTAPADRQARVWREGDAIPNDARRFRDNEGDEWTIHFIGKDGHAWLHTADSPSFPWASVLKWGPLTEVLSEVVSPDTTGDQR